MLRKEFKDSITFLLVIVIFAAISFVVAFFFLNNHYESSPETVTNADFTANDGQEVRAVEYTIITDMDTGIQYVYFEGYGVSPLITEDGTVSKTIE